ncbi:hypothetical protein [Serratia ureilytica]|uniref:hypothetical protein n=1 Tax=Serratia TaxID=613 RepID=UPI0018D91E16|nr:hypothetical protein [Serratia ureilytica]MBH2696231.1 hypothetical protein [Serratia marcescens]MBH2807101.1 hypothetical protein [Serratia marcescens]MBN5234726.1 hypothetical protein [Serratia marcescens]
MDEVVVLERIELIARLGVCYESEAKDKDIALIWILELAGEIKTSITPSKKEVIKPLDAEWGHLSLKPRDFFERTVY